MTDDGGMVLNWSFDVQAPTARQKRALSDGPNKWSKRSKHTHSATANGAAQSARSPPNPNAKQGHKAVSGSQQQKPRSSSGAQSSVRAQNNHTNGRVSVASQAAPSSAAAKEQQGKSAVHSAAPATTAAQGQQGPAPEAARKVLKEPAVAGSNRGGGSSSGKGEKGGGAQRKHQGGQRQRLDEVELAAADSDEEEAVMALVARVASRDAAVEKQLKESRRVDEDDSEEEEGGRDLDRLGTGRVRGGSEEDGVVEFDDEEFMDGGKKGKGGSTWTGKKGEKAGKGSKKGESKGRGAVVPTPGKLAHTGTAPETATQEELFGNPDTFSGLGLTEALASHLEELNFTAPTRVQQASIPVLLRGKDALVQAPTGSGKTLCYVAPIVQQLAGLQPRLSRGEGTYAVVIAPTRELCMQINDVLLLVLRRFHWIVSGLLIGGENRQHEKARLRKGCTILVATPGRLLDHLVNTESFRCTELRWLVLDEADRLLDLGFEVKLKEIISHLEEKIASQERQYQTVLLSATLHSQLSQLASMSLVDPVAVGFTWEKNAEGKMVVASEGEKGKKAGAGVEDNDTAQKKISKKATTGEDGDEDGDEEDEGEAVVDFEHESDAEMGERGTEGGTGEVKKYVFPQTLKQQYVEVPAKLRLAGLVAAVRSRLKKAAKGAGTAKLVVFLSSCDSVEFHHKVLHDVLPTVLKGPFVPSSCVVVKLHGDMPQSQRTASFLSFTTADTGVLLCTDVAARGLDFPSVTSIIQFDPPGEVSEYVHRVGRTARIGQGGDALLFTLPSECGYVESLGRHGVDLGQEGLGKLLSWVPLVAQGPDGEAPKSHRKGRASPEASFFAAAQQLHSRLLQTISSDTALSQLAADAFRSCVRSYTTHPTSVKKIFNIRLLHLGHVAHSFGLSQQPKMVGASGSKAERKKRRKEAAEKLAKKQKKAMRGTKASHE